MRHHTTVTPTRRRRSIAAAAALVGASALGTSADAAKPTPPEPSTSVIASGIDGPNGSAIGPDGALYVTDGVDGEVLRVDPVTTTTSTYATGLPERVPGVPIGGVMDVAFHDGVAYALVSLVGPFFGTSDPSGVYRMDGPSTWTLVADLGAWAIAHPPDDSISIFITTGVHYSIDNFRDGFVVTDAHHNKVLRVGTDGAIDELHAFGNVVPTGLDTWGHDVLVALAGPQPHVPEDGRIVSISATSGAVADVAAGGPLLLDVERGPGATLWGLAQGHFTPPQPDGNPADPDTGELLMADGDGGFVPVVTDLDRPTSFEIVGTTAYVVGLSGEVVRVSNIAGPPFGRR